MTETEASANGNGHNAGDATEANILRQIEHYFGDYNLPRDKFLQEEIKKDDGWVSMETMLKFKRLANICSDAEKILAVLKSSSSLMEVDEAGKKIRRVPDLDLPEWNDARRKDMAKLTVYCKGFDKDKTTLDELIKFFNAYENVINVSMRTFVDRKAEGKKGFKGSVYVTFKDRPSTEKFMEIEGVKYGEVELIRKFQEDYFQEKEKEYEDRKKAKKEDKQKLKQAQKRPASGEEKGEEEVEESLPKGAVLKVCGLNADTKREDIKQKLQDDFGIDQESIAFVNYEKGQSEASLRFKKQNAAVEAAEKMSKEDKIEIKGAAITYSVLEGEDEEAFLKQCILDIKERKAKMQQNKGHKRRGGFSGRGRGGKRSRN